MLRTGVALMLSSGSLVFQSLLSLLLLLLLWRAHCLLLWSYGLLGRGWALWLLLLLLDRGLGFTLGLLRPRCACALLHWTSA